MTPNPETKIKVISEYVSNKNKKYSRIHPDNDGDSIVITGMSGKFPNSRNINEYKYNLYNKVDMVDEEETRWEHYSPEIPKRAGKLYDLEKFDSKFFGISFKQAHVMDPQGRILLEVSYEAILDAGINPEELRGSRTGVYVGCCICESEKTWFYEDVISGGLGIPGCWRSMIANRISYNLGLIGPSVILDTACSSSMYAMDSAYSAMRNGEVDAAIIAGANLLLHPNVTQEFARLGVLAKNGYCRPLDNKASGYARAEAINCLFLQRKRDAKRIYGEVVHSKTNCDGFKTEGITYPSGKTQDQLLRQFYSAVDITPNDLGYLEAHSTGTVVGDPEECRAIDNVLCKQRVDPLLVGSVKSNIGHSEAASGICSLVKAVFALDSGKIAPNINFSSIRAEISALREKRLEVVQEITELKKPYIGVNSFGFGGANAHTLLKAIHNPKKNHGLPDDDIPRIVVWAGRTEEAVTIFLDAVENNPLDAEYLALLYNIQKKEMYGFPYRGFGIFEKNGNSKSSCLVREIEPFAGDKRPLVWIFSGLGSQCTQMGKQLMGIPIFRSSIERCHQTLMPTGLDLIKILTSTDRKIFDNILHSFVGIAAIQIALVDILRALKLEPDCIIGYSIGELVCGYADGALTAEQTILAAYYIGEAGLKVEKIQGSLADVGLGYKQIAKQLPESIAVACHNGTNSSTISGPAEEVSRFVARLKANSVCAKEVQNANIPLHSQYVSQFEPYMMKNLKKVIPHPKQRSTKWLSSSVPKNEWGQAGRDLCSPEYYTNSIHNCVLFEETLALLPNNALTIEIAPDGVLQTILRQTMANDLHIPLTQSGNGNSLVFLLEALGKIFNSGATLAFGNLYPAVQFPVSQGTPGIASNIKWDHRENFFVGSYLNVKTKHGGERIFEISLKSDDYEFLGGHVIDGKILMPATGYLRLVWETLSLMNRGPNYMAYPVEFEDVRFLRATNLSTSESVDLKIMIHSGSGNFEITESNSLVMTGIVRALEDLSPPIQLPQEEKNEFPTMCKKDFYNELKLRGYHYSGVFRGVREARTDGLYGKVEWNSNWVSFVDAMLQIHIVGTDSRSLLLPTKIQKLRVNGIYHTECLFKMDPEDQVFDVYSSRKLDRIIAGGIELIGLHASPVQRKKPPGIPVLERYQFISHFPSQVMTPSDAARICVQLGLENNPVLKMRTVEVDTGNVVPFINHFLDSIEDLPLISGEFVFLTDQTLDVGGVVVDKGRLEAQTNCFFIIVKNLLSRENLYATAENCLLEGGFLVARQTAEEAYKPGLSFPIGFKLIAVIPTTDSEVILLIQKKKEQALPKLTAIKVSEEDVQFKWIKEVQAIGAKDSIVLYAENEKLNGLIGLVNCLRKEPDGQAIRGVFIDDVTAPPFDLNNPFYMKQLALGLGINVYRNGQWGTYRHLQLIAETTAIPRTDHIYGNVISRGDLSSLRWFEGPHDPKDCDIKVVYSSINFRDIMLATGRLAVEVFGSNRVDQSLVLGLEYSGINMRTGQRIMSMVAKGGVSSYVKDSTNLIWEVPKEWSLQEAATVPVVYITIYHAFFVCTNIRKGRSILIHAGTGGIGLAAIRVALAYGLEVFTTVSTSQKREYLLKKFPELTDSHIGNSRDTTFEEMIQRETNGNGVDFVLNSLSEDKLLASVRCLGQGGHFLEIGKFDMANDSKLGMGYFLKQITFHAVLADNLLYATIDELQSLKTLMDADIKSGVIKPLPSTVFPASDIEQAFRHMVGGKHIGKVLVRVRDDPDSLSTIPVSVVRQVYFNPELSYVIPGGLGGFGLELADWMAMRGARKLVLSSSRGISNDYQRYRISLWKTYGCQVIVSTADISTYNGCETLLRKATELGSVGGIFNLAVVLRDSIFSNQTPETFVESFAPKAVATVFLDELSRNMCPDLEHFVVFSSVSCGRGNAGQSNYGMANSIMERVVENRVESGFPGKAIQWGAVGEVGLVAVMAEDKIDMEIGGTLQQRISSCLQELDNLLSSPDAIVSSMVVAEKRVGRAGNENITETVMNIMGIRDLKSISLGTTLSEMGMDSLTAVEIKQTLERNFELVLSPQDLRALTFQKLNEYSESGKSDKTEAVKTDTSIENQPQGLDMLIRHVGNESRSLKSVIPLATAADASKLNSNPTLIIPGMEGTIGDVWYTLAKGLSSKATVLQYYQTAKLASFADVTHVLFKSAESILKKTEKFYLIGYSFGAFITFRVARLLEKAGYQGQILLIDGAPHFLQKLTLGHLGKASNDDELRSFVLLGCVNQVLSPSAAKMFPQLKTHEERVAKFIELSNELKLYTKDYIETMMEGIVNRIKMIIEVDLDNMEKLASPITLIRPQKVSLQDIDEDYCLSKLTNAKVITKFLEGNHSTILENPILSQIINEFDPNQKDKK